MKVRPGKRLLLIFAGLVGWSLLCFMLPILGWAIPIVLIACLAASVYEFRQLSNGMRAITVARTLPSPVPRGRRFEIELEISNVGTTSWPAEIRDEYPGAADPRLWMANVDLPAGGTAHAANSVQIPIRGKFSFGPVWLRLQGRWGLLESQQSFGAPESLQVYPESLLSQEELAKDASDELKLLDQLRASRHRGVGTEFESLEEFRYGDDPRRIDWRTSARFRRPIVRRYQIERHRDVILLLDCGRLMGADAQKGTKLDCAVDAALRLIRLALRGGDRCGLGIFDNQALGYLRPIGGRGAMPTFLASLYNVQSRLRESDFSAIFATVQSQQQKRALVVVLSDLSDAETSGRYRRSLLTLAQRHVVLFAALQTPLMREMIEAPLSNLNDAFKKAVTFRILQEREQAIHELRRSGIHVLDIEPSQLTAPLLNQFIELRGANIL